MDLSDRLRSLDKRARATRFGGGLLRARRPEEDVATHLRYIAENSMFGVSRVPEDVLVVLDRVAALEQRVEALERRGSEQR